MATDLQAAIARLQLIVDDGGGVRHLANVDDLRDILADHARLEAVVEKVPKTADGVIVREGMAVWTNERQPPSPWRWEVCSLQEGPYHNTPAYPKGQWSVWLRDNEPGQAPYSTDKIYSTESAAREAAGGVERCVGNGCGDGCGGKGSKAKPHTCPFRVELYNDSDTRCTCCDECEIGCIREV